MDEVPHTDTRFIVMGSAPLTVGFSVIGAETHADATPENLETLLAELVHRNEKALLLLEHYLAHSEGPWLRRVRAEGGRIVVVEIPPLQAPGEYHPPVEDLVRAVLGAEALKE